MDNFVESLSARLTYSQLEQDAGLKGSCDPRMLLDLSADIVAATHLRDAIRAAIAIAQAETARIEAEASDAIDRAFAQFRVAREVRRKVATAKRSPSQPQQPVARAEQVAELIAKALEAKHAVAVVIADRNRLAEHLTVIRARALELRTEACQAAGDPDDAERIRARASVFEAEAAQLARQHESSVADAEQLKLKLRNLVMKLPEPAAQAIRRATPDA